MRWTVQIGQTAAEDLAGILAYTADTFGARQAQAYKQTLIAAVAALGDGPNIAGSSSRNEIAAGIRTLHVARQGRRGRHFIVYRRSSPRTIRVLRILHDAMDLTRHVPPDPD